MKKIIALVCVTVLLASVGMPFAVNAENAGVSFDKMETYTTEAVLSAAPLTLEVVINVPKTVTGRAGVIFGNYTKDKASNNFEIYNNGVPRFYVWASSEDITDLKFTNVNVCTGENLHLAITIDTTAGKAHCYVDGELKQTLDCGGFTGLVSPNPYMVGGDLRSGNEQYFKGLIKSVAVFSDCRSADEVKADMTKVNVSDDALLVSYDFTASGNNKLKDASKNSNDLIYSNPLASREDVDGLDFSNSITYRVEKPYTSAPVTYEAWVNVPTNYAERLGVIVGNFGAATPCLNIEIYTNGNPRFYYVDSASTTHSIVFDKVDVRTGSWEHIAIVYDTAGNNIKCYLNGELKQTLAGYGTIAPEAYENAFGFAGDWRSGNTQYFKGALKGVTLYSDVRTAEEIKADMNSVDTSDATLLAHYDLLEAEETKDIKDSSSNGYNIKCNAPWFKKKDPVTDYAYSFCVVGDTQKVAYLYPDKFHCIYDWIVENKEEKKIEFVFGLGDITDKNTEAEWELVKPEIFKLNGVVPYSLVRGNHDGSTNYNKYFRVSEYTNQFDGFYSTTQIENSWRTFSVCGVDYLLITMDYGASDAVLNWAAELIQAHPDHRVIITTHAYLFRDGTTLDVNDVVPPNATGSNDGSKNNGDQMWDKLISRYENIFLVISGHDPCDNIIVAQDKGVHGNVVTQMLVDPQGVDAAQGPTGMVAMLYFSNDGKTLTVENYSTVRDEFYMSSNQMTIQIPEYKKSSSSDVDEPPTVPEVDEKDPVTEDPITKDPNNAPTVPSTTAPENNEGGYGSLVVIISLVVLAAAVILGVIISKKRTKF